MWEAATDQHLSEDSITWKSGSTLFPLSLIISQCGPFTLFLKPRTWYPYPDSLKLSLLCLLEACSSRRKELKGLGVGGEVYLRHGYMSWAFINQRWKRYQEMLGWGHLISAQQFTWNPRLLHLNVDFQAVQKVYWPTWEDRSFWHS